ARPTARRGKPLRIEIAMRFDEHRAEPAECFEIASFCTSNHHHHWRSYCERERLSLHSKITSVPLLPGTTLCSAPGGTTYMPPALIATAFPSTNRLIFPSVTNRPSGYSRLSCVCCSLFNCPTFTFIEITPAPVRHRPRQRRQS